MGVFPSHAGSKHSSCCLPHVRGGVSISRTNDFAAAESSPRPWGCFRRPAESHQRAGVFPTSVGVFLGACCRAHGCLGLPHVRGGVSVSPPIWVKVSRSSPRPWGCFWMLGGCRRIPSVFPTSVGVFPGRCSASSMLTGLPHVRGGVSAGGSGAGWREQVFRYRPLGFRMDMMSG